MQVEEQASLAHRTTLGVGGPARRLVTADRSDDIVSAARETRGEPLFILGGGSNLVIADSGFPGTVVHIATRGITFAAHDDGRALVTAEAGEPWDAFVGAMVDSGLSGVECLPGLVGAVPMQNVGAYGQDVSETITAVHVWDRERSERLTLDHAACAFAYRSSSFRGKDRHVILAVTFALERSRESRAVRYAELARGLGVALGQRAPLETVRQTIVALRRKKGMVLDPADPDTASAGSFFTNPILSPDELAALRARAGDTLPVFAEPDGRSKVSAGWLIEQAGFTKGFALGRAAVSTKHALALTNRGGATTTELVALARRIRDDVEARFGVRLENEPVFVGVSL